MPRYMFHVVGRDQTFVDDEGMDLSDLNAATEEARKDAHDFMKARFERVGGDWSNWTIDICDPDGRLLASVPFVADPS